MEKKIRRQRAGQVIRQVAVAWAAWRRKITARVGARAAWRLASGLILIFLAAGLAGCYVSERGISNRYYDECREYYDAAGVLHRDCPKNWISTPNFLKPQN